MRPITGFEPGPVGPPLGPLLAHALAPGRPRPSSQRRPRRLDGLYPIRETQGEAEVGNGAPAVLPQPACPGIGEHACVLDTLAELAMGAALPTASSAPAASMM